MEKYRWIPDTDFTEFITNDDTKDIIFDSIMSDMSDISDMSQNIFTDIRTTNYEEVKLPLFKRGDRVLVKDFNSDTWKEAIYSFTEKVNEKNFYCVVGGCGFYQCIPFDINKLGKVTNE